MADVKQSERDQFRDNLEMVVNVAKKMRDICPTVDGLIEVCELATVSDAQLELLIRAVAQGKR